MSESISWSRVSAINEPQPRSWYDYERGCLLTYRGGHHDEPELGAFQHGMRTVFTLLRAEFPEAQTCKAAPQLLEAAKAVAECHPNELIPGRLFDRLRAVITAAEGGGGEKDGA